MAVFGYIMALDGGWHSLLVIYFLYILKSIAWAIFNSGIYTLLRMPFLLTPQSHLFIQNSIVDIDSTSFYGYKRK